MSEMYLKALKDRKTFNRADLLKEMHRYEPELTESAFKARLQKHLRADTIMRVGRNMYCVPKKTVRVYQHEYSTMAEKVAEVITDSHPLLDFSIFELVQLNEFVNHQMAHNIIFVYTEADIVDFVFDTLKENFPGKVLVNPTAEMYQQYWYDGMVVLEKLVSEAPMGKPIKWHTRIEKMLVDVMADRLIRDTVSQSEYPNIYTDAFERYVIDESCMFRYAKRRNAELEIRRLIESRTKVILRTEK